MAMSARINSLTRIPPALWLVRTVLSLLFALAWLSPARAQVCDTPNLARAGSAVAHSTYPGYAAQRVNDGNRSTELGPQSSWINQYNSSMVLDIFLPKPANIDRVQLFTTLGYEASSYDIQLRVNGSWMGVYAVRGNTMVSPDHRFTPRLADAVRIVGISGSAPLPGYFRVNELEVYDCRSTQSARLSGRVIEFGTRLPVANVVVDLGGGRTATSDAAGYYSFPALPAGTYVPRPLRAGWSFGSDAFLRDHYSFTMAGGNRALPDLLAYRRNPVVYVTGWTDNVHRFNPVTGALEQAGYRGFDGDITTSVKHTPPLRVNAERVRSAIDLARYYTGQPRVILFGHSMGGLISRAYVESNLYRNDVSQVFTFGAPHRGAPLITGLACVANHPAVCEMSKPGMMLFNMTHAQRPGVVYHVLGGDAPMWKRYRICFRIFGRRFCPISFPWPTFEFRNAWGWLSGLLIPGEDDGLIQTYSSTGMPGYLDRMKTQEVHIQPALGSRDYYKWRNSLSGHAYWNCVYPVLVARSRSNCGSASPRFRLDAVLSRTDPLAIHDPLAIYRPRAEDAPSEADEFNQRTLNLRSTLKAGETIEREVLIDGSPTVFAARWSAGSARLTLVDPGGQRFDPEFAASVYDGEPTPDEPIDPELDPGMVVYQGEANIASYQFPAPRPGRWRMIVEGGSDIEDSTELETSASFASTLGVALDTEFPFVVTGTQAELVLTPTSALLSAEAEIQVRTLDGRIDKVPTSRRDDGRFVGLYPVPDVPGIAEVSWFVSGVTATGREFERGGGDALQIGKRTLQIKSVGTEVPVASSEGAGKQFAALEVPLELYSEYAGAAMVSADLVDGEGRLVAKATQSQEVAAGANAVRLRFAGEDILASRRSGPYRVTNLITADQREAANLSDWLHDQLITQSYDYRLFGPEPPRACGLDNLLYGGAASATDTAPGYSARRVTDGDTSTAFGGEYSWSSAGGQGEDSEYNLLQVALPSDATVDQVLVYTTAGWEMRDYDLEYLDGETWQTLEQVRGNTRSVREHRFAPTKLGQLRVVGFLGPDHDPGHVRINEIAAYDCGSVDARVRAHTVARSPN